MKVRLYVERLVLEGLSVPPAARPRLQASIESELARRIAVGGLDAELARGIAVPSVPAPPLRFASDAEPAHLGSAIARAVFGGVGGKP